MKKIQNNNGITAVYARRSVADRDNNSLSIESQKEDCINYIGENTNYKVYCDNGFSGKDTEHRPAFQTMMQDARDGLISRIVVKKYDRFSRNLCDYLNVSEELDKLGVTVYSLSEPFNTATKEGRMMRNNLLNFAEFERETIASRVADAYNTRGRETGFYQGGTMCFGYSTERRTINGKKGSVLVPGEQAFALQTAYEMYGNKGSSLREIIQFFRENQEKIHSLRQDKFGGKDGSHNGRLNVGALSTILSNPIYVRADKNVYEYFQTQEYEIMDDISAYDGVHGVYMHNTPDGTNKYVKVGYHEGLVDADLWLKVQDRKSKNRNFSNGGKAKNSWLVGLMKCRECGYSVLIDKHTKPNGKVYKYLFDSGYTSVDGCQRSYSLTLEELENRVFDEMKKRLESLEIAKKEPEKKDLETEKIKGEIIRINGEIHSLTDRIAQADDEVFAYINQKIKELHKQKIECEKKLQTKSRRHKEIESKPLKNPLNNWKKLTIKEQHEIAGTLINAVFISHSSKEIEIDFAI